MRLGSATDQGGGFGLLLLRELTFWGRPSRISRDASSTARIIDEVVAFSSCSRRSLQNSHSNGSERGANGERARIAHGERSRGCLKPHKPRADAGHRCAHDGQFPRPRDVLKLKMMGKSDMPGQVGDHTLFLG